MNPPRARIRVLVFLTFLTLQATTVAGAAEPPSLEGRLDSILGKLAFTALLVVVGGGFALLLAMRRRRGIGTPAGNAGLTVEQRNVLLSYLALKREKAPSAGRLMAKFWRAYAVLGTLVLGFALLALFWLGELWVGALAVGMLLGRIAGDFAYRATLIRIWPALSRVIDWKELEGLAGVEAAALTPTPDPAPKPR